MASEEFPINSCDEISGTFHQEDVCHIDNVASVFGGQETFEMDKVANTNNNSEYTAATDVAFNIDLEQTTKSSRKRKLDDEGFVTPATPDIPKSSSKYEMPTEELNEGYYDYKEHEGYSEENPLLAQRTCYKTSVDLLKDKAEEFKMTTLEWCREFGDSENFESFCASRLDQVIAEARNLEDNLKKQKEILRQRLGFISRTLQEV